MTPLGVRVVVEHEGGEQPRGVGLHPGDIPTGEGWLYLATVIDLASRRLLGWSMSDAPDAQLMIDALEHAVAAREVTRKDGVIFHSDRGTQYLSHAFAQACWRLGVVQPAGRTASCLDTAAERFFASLKVELVHRCRYQNRAEARTSIFAWIARYNHRRLYSTLSYLPPIEWEEQHRRVPAAHVERAGSCAA